MFSLVFRGDCTEKCIEASVRTAKTFSKPQDVTPLERIRESTEYRRELPTVKSEAWVHPASSLAFGPVAAVFKAFIAPAKAYIRRWDPARSPEGPPG